MRMRQGRFRSRVVSALGTETKYMDYHALAGAAAPVADWNNAATLATYPLSEQYVVDLCQPWQFPPQVTGANVAQSESAFLGQGIFLRNIQVFYALAPGFSQTPAVAQYPQVMPVRIRFALLRSDMGFGYASTQPFPKNLFGFSQNNLGNAVQNSALNSILPRQLNYAVSGGSTVSQLGVKGLQVLKKWSHIVRPWDNASVQNQDLEVASTLATETNYAATGAIGGEKIIVRKKYFTINTRLRANRSHSDTSDNFGLGVFLPQYMLMYYVDELQPLSGTTPPSNNPVIAVSVRASFLDT